MILVRILRPPGTNRSRWLSNQQFQVKNFRGHVLTLKHLTICLFLSLVSAYTVENSSNSNQAKEKLTG
jgi:hypothetical protein